MNAQTSLRRSRQSGHTLIELMIAIAIGTILVLAAFTVLGRFEGGKRTTTALNDALQSGNFGLYEIDKMARSAGTGLSRYAALGPGYGCKLNYTPIDAASGATGTTVGAGIVGSPGLPAPFAAIGTNALPLRLAPVVIFRGATTVSGSTAAAAGPAATADALLFMLGGAGYGETPVPVTGKNGPIVDTVVGFNVGDWVVDAGGSCLITRVAPSFLGSAANNVVLPIENSSSVSEGDLIINLGGKQAANFVLYGVDANDTLRSVDLLNSSLASTQNVADDIVMLRALYGVQPTAADPLTFIAPATGQTVGANSYDYSAAALLDGTPAASQKLASIRAVRVALIVRAGLNERNSANLPTSYAMFASIPPQTVTWYVPAGTAAAPQNYRYREIETTIPIRNNGML